MLKANVLMLEKHVDAVTRALGENGAVHLVDAVPQSQDKLLEGVDRQESIQRHTELLARCRTVMANLGVSDEPVVGGDARTLHDVDAFLGGLEKAFETEEEAISGLITESGLLSQQSDILAGYPVRHVSPVVLRNLVHLWATMGCIRRQHLPDLLTALGEDAIVLYDHDLKGDDQRVLVISSRRRRWALDEELARLEFRGEELPENVSGTFEDELAKVTDSLTRVGGAITAHRASVREFGLSSGVALNQIVDQLSMAIQIGEAQQHFGKATQIYCVSGWIPSNRKEDVVTVIDGVTHGTGIVEFIAPEDDEDILSGRENVPVKFAEIAWLKPFQGLVSAFGAPRYNEVEPSLFVALSFVVMFGIMFGDVGQGLVIAAGGVGILRSKRPAVVKVREAGYWLLFCGLSAAVFGMLYGSLFGNEEIIPHLWVQPLRSSADVMTLFKGAVVLGVILISIGVMINIVNRIRAKDYLGGFLDKFGVIGIVFYWGSLGIGLRAATHHDLRFWEIFVFVILPLLILFMREPLYNLVTRKQHMLHEDIFTFALTSAIEVMEAMTAFLGSTVSFARLGGFALSHAALCLAIYQVVDMLEGVPGQTVWSLLLIIAGNMFVIVLEGMVATIQGVRLQYYELFSKYFPGEGTLYHPFRIAGRQSNIEGDAR